MKLLFDIGNSRCKYVKANNDKVSEIEAVNSDTIDETWLNNTFNNVSQCIISNVNNVTLSEIIKNWCKKNSINYHFVATEPKAFGVECAYPEFKTLGVDRWVAVLAANITFQNQHSLIIDLGTATTIDFLSKENKHIGGWIIPGINLLISSLLNNTENIQAKNSRVEKVSLAQSTSDGVNRGAWASTVGAVNTAIQSIYDEYIDKDEALNIILTGGNAKQFSALLPHKTVIMPELLFIGLNRFNATSCL